jgi:hypothetical protein
MVPLAEIRHKIGLEAGDAEAIFAQYGPADLRAFLAENSVPHRMTDKKEDLIRKASEFMYKWEPEPEDEPDLSLTRLFNDPAQGAWCLPVASWISAMSDDVLVEEIRGWIRVYRLPDGHDLSRYEMEQYLSLLIKRGNEGRYTPDWNESWRETLVHDPEEHQSLRQRLKAKIFGEQPETQDDASEADDAAEEPESGEAEDQQSEDNADAPSEEGEADAQV